VIVHSVGARHAARSVVVCASERAGTGVGGVRHEGALDLKPRSAGHRLVAGTERLVGRQRTIEAPRGVREITLVNNRVGL